MPVVVDVDIMEPAAIQTKTRSARIGGEGVEATTARITCRQGTVEQLIPHPRADRDILRAPDPKRMERQVWRDQFTGKRQHVSEQVALCVEGPSAVPIPIEPDVEQRFCAFAA